MNCARKWGRATFSISWSIRCSWAAAANVVRLDLEGQPDRFAEGGRVLEVRLGFHLGVAAGDPREGPDQVEDHDHAHDQQRRRMALTRNAAINSVAATTLALSPLAMSRVAFDMRRPCVLIRSWRRPSRSWDCRSQEAARKAR